MKAVVDTNVFVSGFLSPFGRPAEIVRLVLSAKVQLLYDARILSEYREVLSRPHFHFHAENIETLMAQIRKDGIQVAAEPLPHPLQDVSDEMFLEVAYSGGAECLITGNSRHFPPKQCRGIRVFDPAGFIAYYQKKTRS